MGHKKRIFVTPFFLPSLIPFNFRVKTTFFRKNKADFKPGSGADFYFSPFFKYESDPKHKLEI
ncbi:hypothetical protein [Leptospira santarosai]|uniref:hypothetical protein n=1 Tax=Leptospira santarosai TaxID=28183 RepID=UPI0002BC5D1A|nr:hypothetical protein [Leptospira santarosai]EMF89652.1 hypothetical protein LEP1GSC005_2453 [Leptospira santarosai str. ST188]EMO70221.1 hypothetical protein LEP1GSC130_3091 [Leptospira santarosai str. 200403458]EMO96859.1 hypothetical protein LEP1GSC120_3849 [Leptospira santarosai str. 200702252]MDI7165429.1 hypothetical protein [Leptospira santarosai]MDI7216509.1 hypothetical protein [Leptospira santarosai]